jgi:DmsE family decaheme c-type cytochrome
MMTHSRTRLSVYLGLFAFVSLSNSAFAATPPPEQDREYSPKGADTCLKCHDEDNEYPVLPIFKTKHGELNDPRSPMAKLQCETCHGPVGDHQNKPRKGEKKAPIRAFGKKKWTPIPEQNEVCLSCHRDHNRMNWSGGPHDNQSMACADCHVIHSRQDPMLDTHTQVDKCISCHLKQRAEFSQSSSHPVRFGKMQCTNCHNPHGSYAPSLLKDNNVHKTDLCVSCHAEKRGPLLWAHAPVEEDCTLCHSPHGSIHPALLKKRPPLLCQQCHAAAGHPSIPQSGDGLPSGTPSAFLLGRSCLNCHSQVHGSNHPSGVKLLR